MSLRKNLAITFSSSYLKLAIGFISSVILARLLTPEDFGIYSIAASVVAFGYMYRNFGVAQYIVQTKDLTTAKIKTAFGITLIISWLIGLIVLISAIPLANFYAHDGIAKVMSFLSINFFMLPFGSITQAILRRNMEFKSLAITNIMSAIAGFVFGVTSAYYGQEYMSIVWGSNATTFTLVFISMLYRPAECPLLPSLSEWREVVRFGMHLGTADLINQTGDSMTELIIGKIYDLSSVGIYSRAYGALQLFKQLFLRGISTVILPYYSESRRNNSNMEDVYLKTLTYITIFSFPFYSIMYCLSDRFISICYGSQWIEASIILKYMCLGGAIGSLSMYLDQLYISAGESKSVLKIQAISQMTRLVTVLVFVSFELKLAAFSLAVFGITRIIYGMKTSPEYIKALKRAIPSITISSITSLILILSISSAELLLGTASPVLEFLILGVIALFTWTFCVYLFKHSIREEIDRWIKRSKNKH